MRALRRAIPCLLPNELVEIDANDDNLLEEDASFLSLKGATIEPIEDMAVKVDAINSFTAVNIQQSTLSSKMSKQ